MKRLNLTRMGQRVPEEVYRSLPGDRCTVPGCTGVLTVYHSRVDGEWRVRYLECSACGFKPADNKWVVPES